MFSLIAENRSVGFDYKWVSGIQPDPVTTDTKTTEDDSDSSLPLILGCVLGVVLLIVIILAVVLYQRHLAAKSKVSHENIRSPQPIKNDCVENPAYEGSGEYNSYRQRTPGKGNNGVFYSW